jgi:hypothetical protein
MDIATTHISKGHEVRIGNIDNLAREYKKYKKSRTLTQPNDNYHVGPQVEVEEDDAPEGWVGR